MCPAADGASGQLVPCHVAAQNEGMVPRIHDQNRRCRLRRGQESTGRDDTELEGWRGAVVLLGYQGGGMGRGKKVDWAEGY